MGLEPFENVSSRLIFSHQEFVVDCAARGETAGEPGADEIRP